MVLGYSIQPGLITAGGILVGLLVILTMLVGLRIIHFKGRRHLRVHKSLAWSVVVVAAVHGLLALAYFEGWKVLS